LLPQQLLRYGFGVPQALDDHPLVLAVLQPVVDELVVVIQGLVPLLPGQGFPLPGQGGQKFLVVHGVPPVPPVSSWEAALYPSAFWTSGHPTRNPPMRSRPRGVMA